jgi:hypothetical protein
LIKQQIAALEQRLVNLEAEKHSGREMDAVESEMTQVRQQIATLRRKFVNYFYYF